MSYKLKTPYLGIPVPKNEQFRSDVEWKKALIIENMLIAGTQGVKFVVFDDGDYRVEVETDDTWIVSLSANGRTVSAHGIVNGAYFTANPESRWTGLRQGQPYWLYLKGGAKTFEDHTQVRSVSSLHPLEGPHLLMATVDQDGTVNPHPDGKLYSKDFSLHVTDGENPHGRELHQDVLVVREKLVLPEGEVCGRQTEVVDFESFGPDGGVKSAEGTVVFAQVQRRVVDGIQGTLGEVMVGYHGQDSKVDTISEFAVYNTGDENIPLRALVVCE